MDGVGNCMITKRELWKSIITKEEEGKCMITKEEIWKCMIAKEEVRKYKITKEKVRKFTMRNEEVGKCALIAHRHSYGPPRCRTSQYRRTLVPLSVSLRNDLSEPVFDGVGLAGFKSRANAFPVGMMCSLYFVSYYFTFFLFP